MLRAYLRERKSGKDMTTSTSDKACSMNIRLGLVELRFYLSDWGESYLTYKRNCIASRSQKACIIVLQQKVNF